MYGSITGYWVRKMGIRLNKRCFSWIGTQPVTSVTTSWWFSSKLKWHLHHCPSLWFTFTTFVPCLMCKSAPQMGTIRSFSAIVMNLRLSSMARRRPGLLRKIGPESHRCASQYLHPSYPDWFTYVFMPVILGMWTSCYQGRVKPWQRVVWLACASRVHVCPQGVHQSRFPRAPDAFVLHVVLMPRIYYRRYPETENDSEIKKRPQVHPEMPRIWQALFAHVCPAVT